MSKPIPVLYRWIDAIKKSSLAPTTRLVLLTLSTYMNTRCTSCFPSTKTLASDTGLSQKSICTHLRIAADSHWIKKKNKGCNGKGWKRHKYELKFPNNDDLIKAVEKSSVTQDGTDLRSAAGKDYVDSCSFRTGAEHLLALKEILSNNTINTTENS